MKGEWQPIETAPKKRGSYVLLVKRRGNDADYVIGFWNDNTDAWDDGDYNSRMEWPTHWMPLPEPPQ